MIGSLIENWYGVFGMYGSGSGIGYGCDFIYDICFNKGMIFLFFFVLFCWNVKLVLVVFINSLLSIVLLMIFFRGIFF